MGWRGRLAPANLLRFDANFTRSDKWITSGIFLWSMLLLLVNIVMTSWNLLFNKWPIAWWSRYSLIVSIGMPFVIAFDSLFWFGIGGVIDTKTFFVALRALKRDNADDGRVQRTEENPAAPK